VTDTAFPKAVPPRRSGAWILLAAALVGAALASGAVLLSGGLRAGEAGRGHVHDHAAPAGGPASKPAADATTWQCPMHPAVVQDHPGDCPSCGMKLVKLDPATAGGSGADAGRAFSEGAGAARR
jgi:membrane fusion protein, copper/silver efflux system